MRQFHKTKKFLVSAVVPYHIGQMEGMRATVYLRTNGDKLIIGRACGASSNPREVVHAAIVDARQNAARLSPTLRSIAHDYYIAANGDLVKA